MRRFQRLLSDASLDGALLSDAADFLYFAGVPGLGVGRPLWLVIPVVGEPTLIAPKVEAAVAFSATWIEQTRMWVEWPDDRVATNWTEPLLEALTELRLHSGALGVECGSLTAATFGELRALLPRATLRECGALLTRLRLRKEPGEIELMRAAGRVAVAELHAARAALRPGAPEFEIALAARTAGTRAAAREMGEHDQLFSPMIAGVQSIVASGPERTTMPHVRASTRVIGPNDVVQICLCGPVFCGYNLGFDRPLILDGARLGVEQERLLDIALEAQQAALARIRPGAPAHEVHAAANAVFDRVGWLAHRAHRSGRGVGVGAVEAPELRETDNTPLEPGMTFTVEPGVYVPGVGGARFGDTVAVTEGGYEMLTPALYGWRGR